MPDANEQFQTCEECGATVYPEHLNSHAAGRFQGRLLCPHCLTEKRRISAGSPADVVAAALAGQEPHGPVIGLASPDELDRQAAKRPQRTYVAGGITMGQRTEEHTSFRRSVLKGPAATRCRTFHCKLSEASLAHLDRLINEWADSHDDVEIKFATSSVGVFEGKHADPNLIVTVFY